MASAPISITINHPVSIIYFTVWWVSHNIWCFNFIKFGTHTGKKWGNHVIPCLCTFVLGKKALKMKPTFLLCHMNTTILLYTIKYSCYKIKNSGLLIKIPQKSKRPRSFMPEFTILTSTALLNLMVEWLQFYTHHSVAILQRRREFKLFTILCQLNLEEKYAYRYEKYVNLYWVE